jgi:hypothetical protein
MPALEYDAPPLGTRGGRLSGAQNRRRRQPAEPVLDGEFLPGAGASCLSAAIYGSGVGDIAGHNPLLRVAQIHPWREWNGVLYPFPRA